MLKENPDLSKETITRPIVTNALTHGLSLIADLFVEWRYCFSTNT